nr:NAD(+)/NADH kinase [uncultured Dethiosulfovibrio sp.]
MREKSVIGLIVNTRKPKAIDLALDLLRWGPSKDICFRLPPLESSVLGVPVEEENWKDQVAVALVIGGDGTFLRAARYVLDDKIALFGVNVGHLGFLAAGDPCGVKDDVLQIANGNYRIQQRQILLGEIYRSGQIEHRLHALNDLVLTKGPLARVMEVDIHICNKLTGTLRADGIIASTPTGSTAYALSAGGPIVPPHVPCMILAPICAHTLYARPMVLGPEDVLTLVPRGESRDLTLTQDGQLGYEILPGDRIEISLSSDKKVDVLWLPDRDYYDLLSKKLMWGKTFYSGENKE